MCIFIYRVPDNMCDSGVSGLSEEITVVTDDDEGSSRVAGLEAKALLVLKGCMEDLPPLPSNTVRIFLSSTFAGKSFT